MTRYRRRPGEVEAVQWTGDNYAEVFRFTHPDDDYEDFRVVRRRGLRLLAGKDGAQEYVAVPVGHWIVRAPDDLTDHWPVDPDYFAAKYEPVDHERGTCGVRGCAGSSELTMEMTFTGLVDGEDEEHHLGRRGVDLCGPHVALVEGGIFSEQYRAEEEIVYVLGLLLDPAAPYVLEDEEEGEETP